MGLYSRYVLPRVVHVTCSANPARRQRMKLVPRASGRVLEVGIGSGLNLPFYDPARVEAVWGLDPSTGMAELGAEAMRAAPFDVRMVLADAESIPVDDDTFDTIVLTYTLCTIPDPGAALREMGRVLAPGGRLLFCEHGLAPDRSVRRWQRGLNPLWRLVSGGCNLDRDIPGLIRESGFEVRDVETMYIPGWRPGSFNYWGAASPA